MNLETVIRQLLASRAQIDATLAVLYQAMDEESAECAHARRVDITELGDETRRYACPDCGHESTED